jgi:signal transduction histidine kinase
VTELFKRLVAVISTTAFRLATGTVALFLVVAALLIGFLFWQTNQVLTEQVVATLTAEAEALQAEARSGGPTALVDAVTARSRPEGPGLYFLADHEGRKLAGNLSRSPPEIAADRSGGVFRYRPNVTATGRERLGVAILVPLKRPERLVIGRDIEDQRAFADGVKRLFLISFIVLMLTGIVAALILSRIVLARIEAMNLASRQIMAGDFSRRVPVEGSGDELDGLAVNLNAMLDRIEQLMTGMREVSENIAHDLKTPLNRLRNRAEAALRDVGGEQTYRDALERTIEGADDLIKTFNALLLIARLEASAIDQTTEAVDCGALVRDVAELYGPVAEEAGLGLSISVGSGLIVHANRQLIGQAVANLIDNAIKYGTADQPGRDHAGLELSVGRNGVDVEIIVADHGPGIAAADRERALRRFVRLDESRTQPGTGLGLSLVAAVARLHGGRVLLEDNAPGLKVRMILPPANRADVRTDLPRISP